MSVSCRIIEVLEMRKNSDFRLWEAGMSISERYMSSFEFQNWKEKSAFLFLLPLSKNSLICEKCHSKREESAFFTRCWALNLSRFTATHLCIYIGNSRIVETRIGSFDRPVWNVVYAFKTSGLSCNCVI